MHVTAVLNIQRASTLFSTRANQNQTILGSQRFHRAKLADRLFSVRVYTRPPPLDSIRRTLRSAFESVHRSKGNQRAPWMSLAES